MQCYLSGMVKHCDSFVNPVCDIREGLNLKNKISIRLNLGGGVVTVQLKCLLKQVQHEIYLLITYRVNIRG